MQLNLTASNAKTVETPTGLTIWARDSAGNEVTLELNERLTKRIVGAEVNKAISNIASNLDTVIANVRSTTTGIEAELRRVHTATINEVKSAVRGNTIDLTTEVDEAQTRVTDVADQYPSSVGGTMDLQPGTVIDEVQDYPDPTDNLVEAEADLSNDEIADIAELTH